MPSRMTRTVLITIAALLAACSHQPAQPPASGGATLTFGSCLRQWQPQPVWQSIAALDPEAFVFLGDNMYADTGPSRDREEPQRIAKAYDELAASPEFAAFADLAAQRRMPIHATWDDHDYGVNDGGADYPHKLQSKAYFMDFFGLAEVAAGDRGQAGIYQQHRLALAGLDVQLLLLDTRSFRSPLKKDPAGRACAPTHNVANSDPDATILGERQWQWLAAALREPADLRIVASSIQVIPEQHCFEKWANFPAERLRLFDLIGTTGAGGVILISGDRHLAEISRLPGTAAGYPLYEVTASGLNSAMGDAGQRFGERNRHRLETTVFEDNFGAIGFAGDGDRVELTLLIHRSDGSVARAHTITLDELRAD